MAQDRSVEKYDVIVAGAGINGSAAAYSLCKRGKKVLLLDQFPLPHTRGGSHGSSRCFRVTYKNPLMAKLSQDSLPLWRDLEKESTENLLIQNGMLTILENATCLQELVGILESLEAKYSILTAEDVNERWQALHLPPGYVGLLDHDAGTLLADKCLEAFQKVFVKHGGKILSAKVRNICPGDVVSVVTEVEQFEADYIIITAGAWTSKLLEPLGVKLPYDAVGVHTHYWQVREPQNYHIEHFPVISYKEPCEIYGMAEYERPGMIKFANNFGTIVDPDDRRDVAKYDNLVEFFQKFMKEVSSEPAITDACLYTSTSDRNFILDRHPQYHNVIFGVFAGHGFKMAPINGEILADLATQKIPRYDISLFEFKRFSST